LPRFLIPHVNITMDIALSIDGSVARHMIQVLRLTVGSRVPLFNGDGGEYKATIKSIAKKEVLVDVTEFNDPKLESELKINLLQAVSRGERMDYTLQKATELGVTAITPIKSERTVVNLKGDRALKRISHWQKIVNGACEQSGRNIVPQVHQVEDFRACLSALMDGSCSLLAEGSSSADDTTPVKLVKLLLHPHASQSIPSFARSLPKDNLLVILLIGPEGGLSPQEHELAVMAGFEQAHLGPRVLRTETAAVVAISILQSTLGDLC